MSHSNSNSNINITALNLFVVTAVENLHWSWAAICEQYCAEDRNWRNVNKLQYDSKELLGMAWHGMDKCRLIYPASLAQMYCKDMTLRLISGYKDSSSSASSSCSFFFSTVVVVVVARA